MSSAPFGSPPPSLVNEKCQAAQRTFCLFLLDILTLTCPFTILPSQFTISILHYTSLSSPLLYYPPPHLPTLPFTHSSKTHSPFTFPPLSPHSHHQQISCVLILGLQAKFAKALHPKSRQLEKVISWNWGPATIWQFFFSKITPPYYTVQYLALQLPG